MLENATMIKDERKPRKTRLNLAFDPKSVVMNVPRLPLLPLLPLLLLPAVVLVSCSMPDMFASSTPHTIQLKNGQEVPCQGAPQYQEKTGYYRYRTPQKRDGLIRADEVAKIVEQRA